MSEYTPEPVELPSIPDSCIACPIVLQLVSAIQGFHDSKIYLEQEASTGGVDEMTDFVLGHITSAPDTFDPEEYKRKIRQDTAHAIDGYEGLIADASAKIVRLTAHCPGLDMVVEKNADGFQLREVCLSPDKPQVS